MSSKLVEFNPHLNEEDGVYRDLRERFRQSGVDNGLQIALAEAFHKATDKSLFSIELERLSHTEELREALDPSKLNFLINLNLKNISYVLDLTDDFGSATHYFASHCFRVDSIKIDPDRCRLAAQRCSSLTNVTFVSEDIENLYFPRKYYDLIVVGDLNQLELNRDQLLSFIAGLRDALATDGVLLIKTSNTTALDRWFHSGFGAVRGEVPYVSLYQMEENQFIFSQFREEIYSAGFTACKTFASFSRGNKVSNLFAEDYLLNSPSALNHIYRSGVISHQDVSEYFLFRALQKSNKHALLENASGFLWLMGNEIESLNTLLDLDFAHYPGFGRRAKWRTITHKPALTSTVKKTSLFPELVPNNDLNQANLIVQNLATQPFHDGHILISDWLDAIIEDNADAFAQNIRDYSDWLSGQKKQLGDDEFCRISYDLLPFNLIVDLDGTYQAIDSEWQLNANFNEDFVIFRALFWFVFENKALIRAFALKNTSPTVADFIVRWHPNLSSEAELNDYAALEERAQAEINLNFLAGSVKLALDQFLYELPSTPSFESLICQLQWGNDKGSSSRATQLSPSLDSSMLTKRAALAHCLAESSTNRGSP